MTITETRKILRAAFGARKYRITESGEILVYGNMPNTNMIGWYLYGSVDDAYTVSRLGDLADNN